MSITLYTAPDCLRCKIVKAWFAEHNIDYSTLDFKEDAVAFNNFYRANRPKIYRNPEGVEFPLYQDEQVIKQGSGEIIAHLLAGTEMEGCVTRSDMLHGWISGLYLSQCPPQHEEHFLTLLRHLHAGGLTICLQSDGRNPDLLQKCLDTKVVKRIILNILGPAAVYEALMGSAPSNDELARTIALVRAHDDHEIRFLASPIPRADGSTSWPTRAEAAEAAQMVATACGDKQLPYRISAVNKDMPQGMSGLPPVEDALLLKYRSGARDFLFKAELAS